MLALRQQKEDPCHSENIKLVPSTDVHRICSFTPAILPLASHFRSKHEKTPRIETKSEVHIIENTLPVRDEPLVVNNYQ